MMGIIAGDMDSESLDDARRGGFAAPV